MLINDYDDEQTLEEEENMSDNSCSNELDELEKVAQQTADSISSFYLHCSVQCILGFQHIWPVWPP